jgi:EamA domain-containing membrane protein RarD
MTTVCDKIDEWSPNYRGYLLNMKKVATDESTSLRAELAVLTVAAVNYVCTWHNAGLTAALNAETSN